MTSCGHLSMDDLSELGLQLSGQTTGQLGCLDDLCEMESENNVSNSNNGRPLSTASFGSWTFSPIADQYSETADDEPCETIATVNQNSSGTQLQHSVAMATNSHNHSASTAHREHVSGLGTGRTSVPPPMAGYPGQVNYEVNNNSCEYVYPNSITYHHSVNIHNYVGHSYRMGGPQVWKPDVFYQMPGSVPEPSESHRYPQQAALQLPGSDHTELLSSISANGLELARCSTPEYLTALDSLSAPDSPPSFVNHSSSAATNINYSHRSFNESAQHQSINSLKHDSGYSSDLSESPIIQFQNGNINLKHNILTSTPQPPPVFRMTSIPTMNKENMSPITSPYTAPKFNMQAFVNKVACEESKSSAVLQSFDNKSKASSSAVLHQSVKKSSVHSGGLKVTVSKSSGDAKPRFSNMAEYQMAKKRSAAAKQRLVLDSEDADRRRHNQPLNNNATDIMTEWYQQHAESPYPNKAQKEELAKLGDITVSQVKSWFANKRNRSNNTRPKKQKIAMEGRLMDICHQLARDARKPDKDNAYYIQQLSSILYKDT